jgi:fibronectin type 3 domain-containing protein
MRRSLRSRLVVLGSAMVAAIAFAVPFAVGSWQSSTSSQSATFSSGTLGTPSGLGVAWGTCSKNVSFQMNLSWTGASNAKSYRVFRGTATGGPYTQIGTTSGTTYTDNGPQVGPPALNWNVTYYYIVSAVAGGWTSASSNEAAMRTPKSANCA